MLVQDPSWQGVQWVENQPKLYYVNMFCLVFFLSLLSNYFVYSLFGTIIPNHCTIRREPATDLSESPMSTDKN